MQEISSSIQITDQQVSIIADPTILPPDQPTAYKKVFGDCCPTPQYTGGCGCEKCTE
jgi:hypothetical protein